MKDELYHHGIEGQRWGVTNGPPYPLSRSVHREVVRSKNATKKRNLSYSGSGKYAKRMSDEDLNATIDRLIREENYRKLVSKDKEAKREIKEVKKKEQESKNQNAPKQKGVIRKSVEEGVGSGIKTLISSGATNLANTIFNTKEQPLQLFYDSEKKKWTVRGNVAKQDLKALTSYLDLINTNGITKMQEINLSPEEKLEQTLSNFSEKFEV